MKRASDENARKFYLAMDTWCGRSYYQKSGTYNVGDAQESPYLIWVKNIHHAQGFATVKAAQAMGRMLLQKHEAETIVVNRDGVPV